LGNGPLVSGGRATVYTGSFIQTRCGSSAVPRRLGRS
jgi:hypothetical protein